MHRFLCVLAALGLLALAGCGGDNGVPAPAEPAPVPLLRLRQIGDTWTYQFAETRVDNVTGQTSGLLGTAVTRIVLDPLHTAIGQDISRLAEVTEYSAQSGGAGAAFREETIFLQDAATRDLSVLGETVRGVLNGAVRDTDIPIIFLPGRFAPGFNGTQLVRFRNGQVQDLSVSITGQEQIATQAGRFDAWKVVITRSELASVSSGIYWYVPGLGNFVRAQETITLLTQTITRTFDMTGTNVPRQPQG